MFILVFTTPFLNAQSFTDERKVCIRVFSNFKQGLTREDQSSSFEIRRAYDYPWYDDVSYKGAFGSNNWLEGWSILWERNIIR